MTANQIDQILDRIQTKNLPPVHLWDPVLSGEMDMRISVDGSWYYQDSKIERKSMVKLFSTILKKEANEYFLVTPVEKYKIVVEDAPFIAVEVDKVDSNPQILLFRTNVDDEVIADVNHQLIISVNPLNSEPRPYLHVRNDLYALLHRNVFYQLVEWAQEKNKQGISYLTIESQGQSFTLGNI